MATIKPIFLLADSQLLFWHPEEGPSLLERARTLIREDEPDRTIQAAYLGASNGDLPEFYDLFVAAMAEAGIREQDCRMIPTAPGPEDLAFVETADLILLAGGDIRLGWEAFQKAGLSQKIVERYYGGALLMGVSAGAVQLGLKGWDDEPGSGLFDTFRIVPFVVDAHSEPSWPHLNRVVQQAGENARGVGIPTGGGAVYHPDYSLEPVRHPVVELRAEENGIRQALLFPGEGSAEMPAESSTPSPLVQDLIRQGALVLRQGSEEDSGAEPVPAADENLVN